MILALTAERQDLAKTVRSFLERYLPEPELRRLMATDSAQDATLWAGLAGMGLMGLAIPERFGGLGCGWSEVGVTLEEAGRALLCVPYFSTAVLATAALLESGDSALQADLLPAIASGELTAAIAFNPDPHGRMSCHGRISASQRDGVWTLSGDIDYALDGHGADVVVVSAETHAGTGLFIVEAAAPGLSRTPMQTLDLTRKLAQLTFDGTPARPINCVVPVDRLIEKVIDIGSTCLGAEHVGGAARVLEMTVAYAKTRYQFGRPIGSFQAIKHICADMLVEVEMARSAAYHALWTADHSPADLPLAACLAKLTCSNAYFTAATHAMQVHGGIGFTWEHSCHLHLKRAKSGQLMFGDAVLNRRLLADRAQIASAGGASR